MGVNGAGSDKLTDSNHQLITCTLSAELIIVTLQVNSYLRICLGKGSSAV